VSVQQALVRWTWILPEFFKRKKNSFPIQPPARFKQDLATAPTAISDYHGCKKSKTALEAVALRGTGSKTSGSLTPAIQI
jgi:hypothetical protein